MGADIVPCLSGIGDVCHVVRVIGGRLRFSVERRPTRWLLACVTAETMWGIWRRYMAQGILAEHMSQENM